MPLQNCPVGEWTTIPPVVGGDMLLESRGMGFYVSTEVVPPTDPGEGYALASNAAMVIAATLPVAVQPAQDIFSVNAYSEAV